MIGRHRSCQTKQDRDSLFKIDGIRTNYSAGFKNHSRSNRISRSACQSNVYGARWRQHWRAANAVGSGRGVGAVLSGREHSPPQMRPAKLTYIRFLELDVSVETNQGRHSAIHGAQKPGVALRQPEAHGLKRLIARLLQRCHRVTADASVEERR